MSDAINKLAIQFAESNRDEERWRHGELRSLRHLLSAVVLQNGGEIVLGDRSRLMARPDDVLEFQVDTFNRCLRIRRPSRLPEVTKFEKPDQLPDWML